MRSTLLANVVKLNSHNLRIYLISQNVRTSQAFSSLAQSLQVRPEPTLVKHLSGTPLEDSILAFPANIRLDWKDLPWTNTNFMRNSKDYGLKSCITLAPGSVITTLHFLRNLLMGLKHQTVCPQLNYPEKCYVTLQLIGPIRKLIRKCWFLPYKTFFASILA